jgi:hypothetical protein
MNRTQKVQDVLEQIRRPTCLGDSVYAYFDGFHIVLCTNSGYGPGNFIALESSVMAALTDYQDKVNEMLKLCDQEEREDETGHDIVPGKLGEDHGNYCTR